MGESKKDPHALALGRKGGLARVAKLGAKKVKAGAKKAAKARWDAVRAAKAAEK